MARRVSDTDVAKSSGLSDADIRVAASEILAGHSERSWHARLSPFLGPAFIAAVAYVDPGNFATNIQAGAEFGYLLVWVIVASNLMAMLVQSLSAKLGIATGRNLAEVCRERFPRPVVYGMWIVAEGVAMATDLAEFLGAALGFNLLFDIPLFPAALLTAVATFLILGLQRHGFRRLEAVITVMVGVIAVCYLLETLIGNPDWGAIAHGAVTPQFDGTESVLLAVGILGATVMPHVIYLHSALTQGRIPLRSVADARRVFKLERFDIWLALGIAGLVNGAMLVVAAAVFFSSGHTEVTQLDQAYRTLTPLLGQSSSELFGVALLVSGLSSSTVGTLAGQVVMGGFLGWRIPTFVRRAITMAPALIVI
ncbi:MAG TPA: Nramp family divalent metal transporter, partial [Thermomicrobiales bacterium]|nr:Nramp family divalent metal transporter [Thermomicrobiales bacterium]